MSKVIEFVMVTCFVSLFIFSWWIINKNTQLEQSLISKTQEADMYKALVSSKQTATPSGLYFNNTMCVYLKGRTWAQAMETCSHEYLHYTNEGHFKIQ